ncbi:recombinase family protein [Naumannella sp. ID2617S]|nr:recombinase family protein [Naumannella sp. ID2617S]
MPTARGGVGYEVRGEFHDNGRTRPALDQALATIRDGQASAIIVADLYRLSRSSTDFAHIIEALDDEPPRGVRRL